MFPRANWSNLLASSPLVVAGMRNSATGIGVVTSASVSADPTVGADLVSAAIHTLNGSGSFNRVKDVIAANATNGAGVIAAGKMVYDGANFQLARQVAAADAQAVTGIAAAGNLLYNGATWDRVRSAGQTGTTGVLATGASTQTFDLSGTSPAAASTVAGTTITGLGAYRTLLLYIGLQGATGGTLDIYLQVSPDGGTTWVDYVHFAQQAAGAGLGHRVLTFSRTAQSNSIGTTAGINLSPLLGVSTVIGGDWGDRMRMVFTAGAGTSAGVAITCKVSATT